jgi:hypothetical protein
MVFRHLQANGQLWSPTLVERGIFDRTQSGLFERQLQPLLVVLRDCCIRLLDSNSFCHNVASCPVEGHISLQVVAFKDRQLNLSFNQKRKLD